MITHVGTGFVRWNMIHVVGLIIMYDGNSKPNYIFFVG